MKWVGGKTRLLSELVSRVPQTFGRYFEPFAGSAALFFALAPERAVLADSNADLITTYRAVSESWLGVVEHLEFHARRHDPEHYAHVRTKFNARRGDSISRAAAFLYLNRTCFNGLWRVNAAGEFNVPIGNYKEPTICDADKLETASRALAKAELRTSDYRDSIADAVAGDFVYFDSPYEGMFAGYTAGGFGSAQQRELADVARDLVARGVHVLLSNSDTPLVREIYDGFDVERVTALHSVNSDGANRKAVGELLVTGDPDRPIQRRTMTATAMPKDQMFLDDSMKPPPDPSDLDIPEVREKIYTWLDLKYEHAQLGERMRAACDAAMIALNEHGIEQHPYIDRKSGKKRFFVADTTPKPKTIAVPRRHYDDDDGDEHGPDEALEDKLDAKAKRAAKKAEEQEQAVEKRTVARASVEADLDPFAATRTSMADMDAAWEASAARVEASGDTPFNPPKNKPTPKRGNAKRGR